LYNIDLLPGRTRRSFSLRENSSPIRQRRNIESDVACKPYKQKFKISCSHELSICILHNACHHNGRICAPCEIEDINGRADNWPQVTIAEIGTAIERLRVKYKPSIVIIAGYSGGAVITAVLLGMKPQLAEAAILVACPCDLVAWRSVRRGMPWVSENPIQWVDRVSPTAKVIALTGKSDDTTVLVVNPANRGMFNE
jgi:pimeloyl-ACP methyl ester carboxylesterase